MTPTNRISLLDVVRRTSSPQPWAEGDNIPWNQPEFSVRMLREHLSQEHDLASRRSSIIDRHAEWLHEFALQEKPGRVLDLACGPGLYLHRLARRGHQCVGIDFSPASIAYARESAVSEGLDAEFVEADLRDADFGRGFDLVTMLYGQFNVFRRPDALRILQCAHDALRPGGLIVVEPQTAEAIMGASQSSSSWTAAEAGLFSDKPHIVLHERFWNEALTCSTERWYVVDASSGEVTSQALTCEAYSRDQFLTAFGDAGFRDIDFRPGLPGNLSDGALFVIVATA